MTECLVATDMDGTLLNHHDYRFDAVLPCLQQLEVADIPVILNTSKTYAELKAWIHRLGIRHPFIVENGSAVFIPAGYFDEQVLDSTGHKITTMDGYQVIVCGRAIAELREYLQQQPVAAADLSACSLSEAVEMTGLSEADAQLAQTRDFSIPLRFEKTSDEASFAARAVADGFGVLRGGRFLHLLGETDKGRSQQLLQQLYRFRNQQDCPMIALGDSPNDVQMLQAADIAVLVDSPSSTRCEINHPRLIRTRQQAPEGWVEGIEASLSMLEDTAGTGAE